MIIGETVVPGMRFRDHSVRVPLDWHRPDGNDTLAVFAREVVDPARDREALPLLLFLQGGPGGAGPRPANGPAWLVEALRTHRVVLLDQRGTGRSGRIEGRDMARFADGERAAAHLCRFRADSIVRDAEHLRKTVFGGRRWETLGQSYGGFITLSYLSLAPEGLSACYVTGGLPGIEATAEEVYRRTVPRMRRRSEAFYRRYPADRALVGRIADLLAAGTVRLADGDRLSVRRLQALGFNLGMSDGLANAHWLFEGAFVDACPDALSDGFLAAVLPPTAFEGNPLYAVLQEAIYAQGAGATAWAAERVMADAHPEFGAGERPLLFPGEAVFPWMFGEIRALRPFAAAAEALARWDRFAPLYDPARLAANDVPVAAAIWFDDLYVDAELSLDTAARVGNLRRWVTDEFDHDGVRASPAVWCRLRDMVRAGGGPLPPGP